jgi:hypothetical protein
MINDVYYGVVQVNLVGGEWQWADIRTEVTDVVNGRRTCWELNTDCGQSRVCAQTSSRVLQVTQKSVDTATSCPNILGDKTFLTSNFSKYPKYFIYIYIYIYIYSFIVLSNNSCRLVYRTNVGQSADHPQTRRISGGKRQTAVVR